MHPALSIIIFTVVSGSGFGLFAVAVTARELGAPGSFGFGDLQACIVTALLLVTLGLGASTMHLANPKNAWRAFSQYRTSWLSREGVLALGFYPLALLYWLISYGYGEEPGFFSFLFGLIAAAVAVATIYATAMIYACLRTIPRWSTPLTPANYLAMGLLGGLVWLAAILGTRDGIQAIPVAWVLVATVVAAALKAWYFLGGGILPPPPIQSATVLPQRSVRLLETGHSSGNFLTREFDHAVQQTPALRLLAFALAFVVPAICVGIGAASDAPGGPLALGLSAYYAGVLLERWLFFVEARHVVNHYQSAM